MMQELINNYNKLNKNAYYKKVTTIQFDKNKKYKLKNYNYPILIKGLAKNTKAYHNWNIDNISQKLGDNKINVEKYFSLHNFFFSNVDIYLKYNIQQFIEKSKDNFLYIGEINLDDFDKPEIFDDVDNKYIHNNSDTSVLFFGNNGSGSGTHIHLWDDYVINQIFGEKTIYLFNFDDNFDRNLVLGNPCIPGEKNFIRQKDFDVIDFNIKLLNHHQLKIYKVVLQPGDSLFIPPWWWHNATSDGFSCSVTKKYPRSNFYYLIKYPQLFLCHLLIFLDCDIYNHFVRHFISFKRRILFSFFVVLTCLSVFFIRIIIFSYIFSRIFNFFNIKVDFYILCAIVFCFYYLYKFDFI